MQRIVNANRLSIDLRQRVLVAYQAKKSRIMATGLRLPGELVARAMMRHYRQTGSIEPKHGGGATAKLGCPAIAHCPLVANLMPACRRVMRVSIKQELRPRLDDGEPSNASAIKKNIDCH